MDEASKLSHSQLHAELDRLAAEYSEKISEARKVVLEVEGITFRADLKNHRKSFDSFVEDADFVVIEDAYRRASRQYSPDVTKSYASVLADRMLKADPDADAEEVLIDAHIMVAAMGLVPEIKEELDTAANRLAKEWFGAYHSKIKSLSDERRDAYRQIKGMSDEPQDVDLARPLSRWEPSQIQEEDGGTKSLPMFSDHLLSSTDGKFPAQLNKWEAAVLKKESARDGFVAWYRNPSNATQDSLGVAYRDGKAYSVMRPDFLFFAKERGGSIAVDLVDPHGTHFADALPKLQGLAVYADAHPGVYRRVMAVAETKNGLRSLDLTDAKVRDEIMTAENAKELFEAPLAKPY